MNPIQIRHAEAALGLAKLNPQEHQFVTGLLQGMPLLHAAREAGIPRKEVPEVQARPHVVQVLSYLREQASVEHVEITRDMLNVMLLQAHSRSANTTEEVMTIRELGKMNGLYAPERREVVETRHYTYEQMQNLSTDELMAIAGDDNDLDPDYAEDAEWEEMPDE